MAKDNKISSFGDLSSAISDQQSAINKQPMAEGKPAAGQPKPEEVLIGAEAFASAKDLEWPIAARLAHYVGQNNITEKTFAEWEAIVSQL